MFRRAVAFTRGQIDVGGSDIILKIDKLFAWGSTLRQFEAQRTRWCLHLCLGLRRPWRLALEARLGSGLDTGRMAFRQTARERKAAVGSTDRALRLH